MFGLPFIFSQSLTDSLSLSLSLSVTIAGALHRSFIMHPDTASQCPCVQTACHFYSLDASPTPFHYSYIPLPRRCSCWFVSSRPATSSCLGWRIHYLSDSPKFT